MGDDLIERIRWWEDYTARNMGSMDNNPSPGNKKGGLTTILEKSLGAAAKGGTTPLNAVYKYGEPIREHGFIFMDSPGYDPASVTGQIASGCNLIVFTTGRGSAFGSKPAPCIKISTNTDIYNRMPDDMDINAGDMLTGEASLQQKGREIYEHTAARCIWRKVKIGSAGPWEITNSCHGKSARPCSLCQILACVCVRSRTKTKFDLHRFRLVTAPFASVYARHRYRP